jgi:hypothetical protein
VQQKKRSAIFSVGMGLFMVLVVGAILVTVALYAATRQSAANASSMTLTTGPIIMPLVMPSPVYMSADELRTLSAKPIPTILPGAHAKAVDDGPW